MESNEVLMSRLDTPPRNVETFYVLDFDRCIGNTNKLHALLELTVASETNITAKEMQQARREVEQSGGSFDTATYVRDKLQSVGKSGNWREVAEVFISKAREDDMLEPGARDLLALLDAMNAPYGILTYGGELWQTTKLLAAGLQDVPFIITPSKEKGRLLADWQQDDGSFEIPLSLAGGERVVAQSLVLIDDKAASFSELPRGARGVHVLPADGGELLASQTGAVPEHVVSVRGLTAAARIIAGKD